MYPKRHLGLLLTRQNRVWTIRGLQTADQRGILMPDLVPLPGSERAELPSAVPTGTTLDPQATITVTLILRRRADVPQELVTGPQTITWGELAERYGASPSDVELVRSTLQGLGLTVTEVHVGSRRV